MKMEHKNLRFKTNLQCGGCVSKVQADLDQYVGENQWQVDTDNPDKLLTVQNENASVEEIEKIIKSKGFTIEQI